MKGKPNKGAASLALRNCIPWWMVKPPEVYAFCFMDGILRFGKEIPGGAIRLYGISEGVSADEISEWLAGRVPRIPGIAEARTASEAYVAAIRFQKTVLHLRRKHDTEHRQAMVDDLDSTLAQAARMKSGMRSLFDG